MASFGTNLRQAREARKMTLQEIAATTKVSTRALQALEDERFDLLPGGIFNKGFVRAYARSVGLDEEKSVAEYLEAAKLATPEIDMQMMSSQVSEASAAAREPGVSAATVVGVLALIVGIGMGGVWLREQRKDSREQAAAQHAAANTGASTMPPTSIPAAPPVAANEPSSASQGAAPEQNAAQNAGQNVPQNANAPQSANQNSNAAGKPVGSVEAAAPVEVSISATTRSWISVRSDGKTVESLTLDPENPEARTRSYKAKEKLTLVVGNPAGLSVTYNGKLAGALGPEGHPETITFTPQGIEKQ